MFWLLLACSLSGPDKQATDPSVPLDQALVDCATHSDPDEAGRCAVTALEARDMLRTAECARVRGRWRGKCVLKASQAQHGALERRYEACGTGRSDARNCRFRLWQADVLALEPGHPDALLELEGMREVVKRHQHHIAQVHPGIGDEMWTRFWGAWWEQQGGAKDRDLEGCSVFQTVIDVHFCKTWAPAAFQWLDARQQSADKVRATDGAPGGPESTPP